jgi:phosphatidylglycerol:prolipoprotein diacylglycerol transferase
LPAEFFEIHNGFEYLKPYESLTEGQKQAVTTGAYRCLPVHPTQLYSSASAFLLCVLLYSFWRKTQAATRAKGTRKLFAKPGCTFALMFILYGVARFLIEFVRDDNPFEYGWLMVYKGGTISQNLSLYLIVLGVVLIVVFGKVKGDRVKVTTEQ